MELSHGMTSHDAGGNGMFCGQSLLIIKKELLPGSGSFLTSMQLLASNSLKNKFTVNINFDVITMAHVQAQTKVSIYAKSQSLAILAYLSHHLKIQPGSD